MRLRRFAWVPLLLALASCGAGDRSLEAVDPDAVDANPAFEQVDAILQRSCVPCHQGEGEDAAPAALRTRALADDAEPNLESCAEVVAQRFGIMEQVDANLMPPGAWPRLTSEEKLTIRRWIDTGAPAPCN